MIESRIFVDIIVPNVPGVDIDNNDVGDTSIVDVIRPISISDLTVSDVDSYNNGVEDALICDVSGSK